MLQPIGCRKEDAGPQVTISGVDAMPGHFNLDHGLDRHSGDAELTDITGR